MKYIKDSLLYLLFYSLILGIIYPLSLSMIANIFFPYQASASLVVYNGKTVGSALLGQDFTKESFFWGRLSATSPKPYTAASSSGTNLALSNPAFLTQQSQRVTAFAATQKLKLPIDLATASGSGLDPEISIAAAKFQIPRVAAARKISETSVAALVTANTTGRLLGIFGESRVNVLKLNLALEKIS